MATCIISSGVAESCGQSIGGVAKLYIANNADITAVTATATEIDGITMATTTQFYEVDIPVGTVEPSAVPTANKRGYQETCPITYAGNDPLLTSLFETIADGAKMAVIYKDNNGVYNLFGRRTDGTPYNDLEFVDTADGKTYGAGEDDFNGYNITVQARQTTMPQFVDASIIDALLTPAV